MNIILNVKAWIARQAKQPSTWIGTSFSVIALLWPYISDQLVTTVTDDLSDEPIYSLLARIALAIVGTVCIIYNQDVESKS